MPIALILSELQKRRLEWTPTLADWSRLLSTEELLWRRVRGVFLRKWFGAGLQMSGIGVLVSIVNIAALRTQFLYASDHSDDGLNLMEPLMGMIGGLVGGVLGFLGGLFFQLSPVALTGILGGLIGLIDVVVIFAGMSTTFNPRLRSAYRASGSMAHLVEEFLTFWGWLTGDRNKIVNPIIRLALDILDQVSVITAQLVAFAGLFLMRIVPWFARLVAVLPAFTDLLKAVSGLMKDVMKDLLERLGELAVGPTSPLAFVHRIIDMLKMLPDRITKPLTAGLKQLADSLRLASKTIDAVFTEWLDEVNLQLRLEIDRTPVVRFFKIAGAAFEAEKDLLARSFPRITKFIKHALEGPGILDRIPPPLPDLGEVEARTRALEGPPPAPGRWDEWWNLRKQGLVPDTKRFFDPNQTSTPADLAPPMSGELLEGPFSMNSDLFRHMRDDLDKPLPDAFAGERARLTERAKGDPHKALLRIHDEELQYFRDVMGSVLDRMIGASGAGFFAGLESKLDKLDDALHLPHGKPAIAPLPVLDVREENRLRLEVPGFRIRYRGHREENTQDMLRDFGADLREAWTGQEYLLPVSG